MQVGKRTTLLALVHVPELVLPIPQAVGIE